MPFMSCLHTAFLPEQQFWDAFTSVEAPQMLPGGLQLCPLSQRGGSGFAGVPASQVTP
jgi:hypothetical protein